MKGKELKQRLAHLALTQAELARLLGVTPRAVTLWASGQRAVPDWCAAYLRVFQELSPDRREMERDRLKGAYLREGMYEVAYRTRDRQGKGATLMFDSGSVWGADRGGGIFDGSYRLNDKNGKALVSLRITFPPNVMTLYGISHPYEWSIDATTEFDPALTHGGCVVRTSLGRALAAEYRYVRPFPRPL